MPVIYFSLLSSGVVSYLYFYHAPENINPIFVDVTFFLFAGTVTGIAYVYYRVAKLVFSDPLDEMTLDQVRHGIKLQLRDGERKSISQSILADSLPDFVVVGRNREGRVFTADELDLNGYISDINLEKLRRACEHAEESLSHDEILYVDFELGRELQSGQDVVFIGSERNRWLELPDAFADELSSAIYCVDERPWLSGDQSVNRNLAQIGESTRKAINDLNPAGLEAYLNLYTSLLDYATNLNRKVISDYGSTPQPVSTLVDRIFREFYRIFEAAGATGNSELINLIRGEIFRISLHNHRQGESHLFDKSVALYGYYYRALASSDPHNQNLIHGLLSSFQNLQTMLVATLERARSIDEVEGAVSDLDSFYDTLENILQGSVEYEDASTFNNAWNLGDGAFFTINPEMDIHELEWQLQESENEEERERLKKEIEYKQRQKEAIEILQAEFDGTRFVAAAWAYQSAKEGGLSEEVFNTMYSESVRPRYSSFDVLTEEYFRLLEEPRLDFFRWESDDSDIFKGVQMRSLAVDDWIKEFFCAMGLLLLDPREFDTDNLTEGNNPLAQLDIDRLEYPDLEEGINRVSKENLERFEIPDEVIDSFEERKELFIALHHHMEDVLERREEDFIIEADLDPEKVENFEENYIEEFTNQFALRQVFSDLGWLGIEEYSGDIDVEASGYNQLFPKGALIENSPTEYVHYLDQKARNHIRTILDTWLEDGVSETKIESHDELLDVLEEVCEDNVVKAIVISGYRARRSLLNDSRFDDEFGDSENAIGGYKTNSTTIPVYKDNSRDFSVLVLFDVDQPPEIKEYQVENDIVNVKIEETTRDFLREQFDNFDRMDEDEIREKLQTVWLRIFYYGTLEFDEVFGTKIITK